MSLYWLCPTCGEEGDDPARSIAARAVFREHAERSPNCDELRLIIFMDVECPPYLREKVETWRQHAKMHTGKLW